MLLGVIHARASLRVPLETARQEGGRSLLPTPPPTPGLSLTLTFAISEEQQPGGRPLPAGLYLPKPRNY